MATDPLSLSKSNITILRVSAKRSRLVIDGEMGYDEVKVPFSYRTSLGVKGEVCISCPILFCLGILPCFAVSLNTLGCCDSRHRTLVVRLFFQ